MATVKDLFENEELMNNIVEDLEDFPEDTEVTYAVWALGHNSEDAPTDTEILVGEFDNPDEAVAFAENLDTFAIEALHNEYDKSDFDTAYFVIEVETVVEDPDDEDGGTMNIGTVYQRDLWLDGEYGSEEETDPIVAVGEDDYELLEDGTLKLSANFMKGFNKNDLLRVQFLGEPDVDLLPYKIMSKVIYEDGDYYHCELMI